MKKGTVAVSVISIAAFCVLAYLVTGSYTQRFDDAFRDMVYALRTSVLTFAAKGFFIGRTPFISCRDCSSFFKAPLF